MQQHCVSPRLRRRRGFGRPVPLPPDTSLMAPLPPRQTGAAFAVRSTSDTSHYTTLSGSLRELLELSPIDERQVPHHGHHCYALDRRDRRGRRYQAAHDQTWHWAAVADPTR